MSQTEIIIIAGSHGRLGRALIDRLSGPGRICCGLQRRAMPDDPPHAVIVPCDLDDFAATAEAVRGLLTRPGMDIGKITLIHAVGPFKYEGQGAHEIDRHVLRMNDEAFENMANEILSCAARMKNPVRVNLCTFGSVSEPYNVPLWFSFNEAKRRVRHFIQSAVDKFRNNPQVAVSGLYLRTSTINTANENNLRPRAPDEVKSYWLEPNEVADTFCRRLDALRKDEFLTADIIKPWPGFDPDSYYRDVAALDSHWRGMMNGP